MAETGDNPVLSTQQAQAQADAIAARVQAQADRVREQQSAALAVTGSASSRDGTVKAVVDATGVVTALEFTPAALERSTLDKLARTVVATIQEAAAQARGSMTETWQTFHGQDDEVLSAAARGTERLGLPRVGVPEVPRTETDPTGQPTPWQPAEPGEPLPGEPAPARKNFDEHESFDDVRHW